jgi:sulfur-oxidizing protein SoxX
MNARVIAAAASCFLAACATTAGGLVSYSVQGDAIVQPLTDMPGEPSRGREVVAGRDANCLLCHVVTEIGQRFMGNVGPPLAGVGARLTPAQLRLRVVDPTQVKPDIAMPAYYRTGSLDRVAEPFRGQPILTAQQIEDVVAYLSTLR